MKPSDGRRACAIEPLEARRLMSGVLTPDAAFSGDGRTLIDRAGLGDGAFAMALQPDGKILVAGRGTPGDPLESASGLLARLNPDGSLDPTFGAGGVVVAEPFSAINSLAVLPGGQILAGGDRWLNHGVGGSATLARYNADGTLDAGFGAGGGGYTRVELGGSGEALSRLALAPDGKIVALDRAFHLPASDGGDFTVVRFNADGTVDTTFGGGDGVVRTDFSDSPNSREYAAAVAFTADGRLVVAGSTSDLAHEGDDRHAGAFALARYEDDGSLDPTFGAGGRVVTLFRYDVPAMGVAWYPSVAHELLVAADGRMLAVGRSSLGGLTMVRYAADGGLDTSFGDGGFSARDREPETGRWTARPVAGGGVAVTGTGPVLYAAVFDAHGALVAEAERAIDRVQVEPYAADFDAGGNVLYVGFTSPLPRDPADPDLGYTEAWQRSYDASADRFTLDFDVPLADALEAAPAREAELAVTVQGKAAVRKGHQYSYKATYASDLPIDGGDVGMLVAGPDGFVADAASTRVRASRDGRRLTVTYRVAAPGGSFDAAENGRYSLLRVNAGGNGAAGEARPASALGRGAAAATTGGVTGDAVGAFQVAARAPRVVQQRPTEPPVPTALTPRPLTPGGTDDDLPVSASGLVDLAGN